MRYHRRRGDPQPRAVKASAKALPDGPVPAAIPSGGDGRAHTRVLGASPKKRSACGQCGLSFFVSEKARPRRPACRSVARGFPPPRTLPQDRHGTSPQPPLRAAPGRKARPAAHGHAKPSDTRHAAATRLWHARCLRGGPWQAAGPSRKLAAPVAYPSTRRPALSSPVSAATAVSLNGWPDSLHLIPTSGEDEVSKVRAAL